MTQMSPRYRARRPAAIRAGTWEAWADSADARKHLARMLATGANHHEIAEATGVARMTLWSIEATDNRILSSTSEAILAMDPASLNPAWPAAGGTRLRLPRARRSRLAHLADLRCLWRFRRAADRRALGPHRFGVPPNTPRGNRRLRRVVGQAVAGGAPHDEGPAARGTGAVADARRP